MNAEAGQELSKLVETIHSSCDVHETDEENRLKVPAADEMLDLKFLRITSSMVDPVEPPLTSLINAQFFKTSKRERNFF